MNINKITETFLKEVSPVKILFCRHLAEEDFFPAFWGGAGIGNRSMYEQFISGQNHTPLLELLIDNDPYTFRRFLNKNETFDENETEKTLIRFEDKLIEIYNALFMTDFTNIYSVNIGEYRFDESVRETIFRTVGLLSNYVKLDEE